MVDCKNCNDEGCEECAFLELENQEGYKKFILDACCGGRMMWFNKNHPNAVYVDIRREGKGVCKERPLFEVNPDLIMDFRDLKFPDKSFKLVVWDPPHIKTLWPNGIFAKKYGKLESDWKDLISKGFEECWRVLDDFGVLIFKWSEYEFKVKDVLKLFKVKPLFGHSTGTKSKTKWMCFMKIPEEKEHTFNGDECSCGYNAKEHESFYP